MEATCHRCHQSLPADSTFCPHCGAAQLYVTTDQLEDTADTSLPSGQRIQLIDWRRALRSALLIAILAAILSGLSAFFPAAGAASFLWILTASSTVIWLYLRPAPTRSMDARIGARIGAVAGLVISALTTFSSALSLVLQRYVFHRGQLIDAQFALLVTQLKEFYEKMNIDQATQQLVFSLIKSPEGQAGQLLSTYTTRAIEITLFLMLTGALSGFARNSKRRTAH